MKIEDTLVYMKDSKTGEEGWVKLADIFNHAADVAIEVFSPKKGGKG